MSTYQFGSVSIFVNVNDKQNRLLDNNNIDKIGLAFKEDLKSRIQKELEVDLNLDVSWERGCLIFTISLGVIVSSAALAYKFIKDYKDTREGLKLLMEDLKNAYLICTGQKEEERYDSHFVIDDKEGMIEILEKIPDEYREQFESGVNIIYEKRRVTTIHKITVFREDMQLEIIEEEIEELSQ